MSGFSADWLTLREPADLAARDPALLEAAVRFLSAHASPRVIDLGCGTGSTVRAMAPGLPPSQQWRLVDHDQSLLDRALGQLPQACARDAVQTVRADLERDLEALLAAPVELITLSAVLDLVSQAWIDRLVAAAARQRVGVYAALSYDGRTGCEPGDPVDANVLAAFNAHQRRDKGLGAALGPRAGEAAARAFQAAGFEVRTARADWSIDSRTPELQRQLLAGWVEAVAQTGCVAADTLAGWHARRLADVEHGRLRLSVGHVDLLALPSTPTTGD